MDVTALQSCCVQRKRCATETLVMMLSSSDFANLAFLELIDEGVEPPDGLDINKLANDGLVAHRPRGWMLTRRGLIRLENLRSLARSIAQAGYRIRR
ncbi:MAG: hypothetical protein WKG03_20990 [Telluria sp.]